MLPNMNLSEHRSESLDKGGYIVKVVQVEIDQRYNNLDLIVDIDEGTHAGYYRRLHDRAGFWGLKITLSLDPDDRWKFAQAVDAFRSSDPSFTWEDDAQNDENNFLGKRVGVVTRYRHYIGNDGAEKKVLRVFKPMPIEDITAGNYSVPDDVYAEGVRTTGAPTPTGNVVDTTSGSTVASEEPPEGFKKSADDLPF